MYKFILLFFLGLIILSIIVVFWLIAKYNYLIRLKALVNEAWSGIDVQLKRRYDLIPNLVQIVKGYATHERNIFENIAEWRAKSVGASSLEQKATAEAGLTQALKTLFAVAENYPELKANQNFLSLQQDLNKIEEELQLARRYYNGAARNYNIVIETFPTNLIANTLGFKYKHYFQAESQEKENPKIKF